jgi:hypothetical protein
MGINQGLFYTAIDTFVFMVTSRQRGGGYPWMPRFGPEGQSRVHPKQKSLAPLSGRSPFAAYILPAWQILAGQVIF